MKLRNPQKKLITILTHGFFLVYCKNEYFQRKEKFFYLVIDNFIVKTQFKIKI